MKDVLLIGATGFVGAAILNELVGRGHHVTAVVRDVAKLPKSTLVTPVAADVSNVDALARLAEGKDAVISAYNPGWTNPNIAKDTIVNYQKIVAAIKQSGVGRLLIVGGGGTLFVAPGIRALETEGFPAEIMNGVVSLAYFYLNILSKEQDLDWVFFSPAGMFDEQGEKTGAYRLGKDDMLFDAQGNSHISVQDYAVAMVDEMETPAHHKERFTIGY